MPRSATRCAAALCGALLITAPTALAKGGNGGGGGGGGATPATDVGSIRQVGTTATCSDGYTFSVSFRKGFDKRVEMQLTFVNQPAGYWDFSLRNATLDQPMGGFGSASPATPSRQITTLTRTVPRGASTLVLTGERRAIDTTTLTSATGAVLATCTAVATVVG